MNYIFLINYHAILCFTFLYFKFLFFFFNDTATTEIYTLSLTTLFRSPFRKFSENRRLRPDPDRNADNPADQCHRSEEHTSELQSRVDLVCRLLLEKKKKNKNTLISRAIKITAIPFTMTTFSNKVTQST